MHGAVLAELRNYVAARHGADAWAGLCRHAGLEETTYDPLGSYADEEASALVRAAAEITRHEPAEILRDFGRFLAPSLLKMFWGAVDPAWKTLELLEHTESTIHTLVRVQNPEARPPTLAVTRPQEDQALIVYRSPRKLCALAKGLAEGVAEHYGESVRVSESSCMHAGADECHILVELVG